MEGQRFPFENRTRGPLGLCIRMLVRYDHRTLGCWHRRGFEDRRHLEGVVRRNQACLSADRRIVPLTWETVVKPGTPEYTVKGLGFVVCKRNAIIETRALAERGIFIHGIAIRL